MIQPTMYFALRHVPLFYGPYWISKVTHNISTSDFTTKFEGVRIPKYKLPDIDNLVASVNKNVLKNFKDTQQKTSPNVETEDEKKLEIDEKPSTQSTELECSGKSVFSSVEYVDLKPTQISVNDFIELLKLKSQSKVIRALIYGIAFTRITNKIEGDLIQTNNCNLFSITTNKNYGGNMDSKILNQTCS
jgi:hypothetical protein